MKNQKNEKITDRLEENIGKSHVLHFEGVYQNKEKPDIYKKIDLINAVYGNESLIVTTSLPNKLYDCIVFKRPIIVHSGTYLSEIVNEYN